MVVCWYAGMPRMLVASWAMSALDRGRAGFDNRPVRQTTYTHDGGFGDAASPPVLGVLRRGSPGGEEGEGCTAPVEHRAAQRRGPCPVARSNGGIGG